MIVSERLRFPRGSLSASALVVVEDGLGSVPALSAVGGDCRWGLPVTAAGGTWVSLIAGQSCVTAKTQ